MRNTGLLYCGEGNLLEHALNKAAEILNTDRKALSSHPDYMYVDFDEGKSSIGVETANLIVNKASLRASFGDYQVCVINHMDSMTEAAQNKLLKTLEEALMVVIGVCYEDGILPTVKSRMQKVQLTNKKLLSDDVMNIFDKVGVALNTNPVDVLSCLNLVKEKDTESFFHAHRENVGELLSFIGNNCSSKLSEEVVLKLGSQRECCMSSSFSKDDFFVLIVTIVEDLRKGESYVTV